MHQEIARQWHFPFGDRVVDLFQLICGGGGGPFIEVELRAAIPDMPG
jgi:hypothetical protein